MALAGEGRVASIWPCISYDAHHVRVQGDCLCHGTPWGYSGAGLQKH